MGIPTEGERMKVKKLESLSLEALWKLFPIVLTPHQPLWKAQFKREKTYLEGVLDLSKIRWIEHIGSTAIESIYAKAIVDILLEVEKDVPLQSFLDDLKQAGYRVMSNQKERLSLNKGYTENGYAEEVFHLHMRHFSDHDELYFRDYLIDFPEDAKVYEALKHTLAKKHKHHRDHYTNEKTDYVHEITQKAKLYYGDKYNH